MKAKQTGFTRTFWLAVLSLAGLASLLGVWLSHGWVAADQLPIRYLRLEQPVVRVNKESLRAALAPWAGSNFFSVDLEQVRQKVEALPWVAHAQVRKAWPDTLWLKVEEHVPVARWQKNQLVDQHGELFDVPPGYVPGDLPLLQADVRDRESVISMYAWLQKVLRERGLTLKRLARDELGTWQLVLGNDIEVMLGRKQAKTRMKTFLRVWESQNLSWQQQLVYADMRYTNGMAIRRADTSVVVREEDANGQGG